MASQGEGENSLKSNETKPPLVLTPPIKCEALHQDYFQTSGAVKDQSDKQHDCQNVTEPQDSFNTPSSTDPCYQSTRSDLPLLSYDNIPSTDHIDTSDNLPQSPDFSADKEIKSTSLSDLCRISPLTLSTFQADLIENKDCSQNQGLSQSCHEYYNTEQTSIDESQKHHESSRSSLIGGSCHILRTSELISCPKSVTNIQQARKRCIPKVGIRTIPLIKIKPDWKLALNTKGTGKKAETGSCKEKEINEEETLLNDQIVAGGKQESESAKLDTSIAGNSKIIGEVILHEPYSREILSSVNNDSNQLKTETEEDLDSTGQKFNTIPEENKVLSEIRSETKLACSSPENSLGILNKQDAESEIEEEIRTPNIQDTPKLKDKLFAHKAVLLDDSETANTTDSLFVNKDEDSLNTVTDILEEEFCTQYSDTEIENQSGNKSAENKDSASESENSDYEELPDDYNDTNGFNSQPVKPSKSAVDGIIDIEKLERKLKPRSCLSLGRDSKLEYFSPAENLKTAELRNIQSDSDGTLYYSFNSLDNVKLNESCGTLCKGTRKLPLKWTPRVLLESRISSLTSGTFSEASFQTADTYRTFYSAQSFQLDSFDNFQTCEDLQACTEQEPKTKFSKAKEAFIRGRDFVKAKFDDYRKRFPNLRRLNLGEQSTCHRSCGFSCVHFGREISQYSLHDTFGIKGDNSKESKEGQSDQCERNCCECEDQDEAICDSNLIMDKDNGLRNNKNQLPKTGGQKRGPTGTDTDGRDDVSEKHIEKIASHGSKGTVKSDMSGREISEDDLPVGSEAISIPRDKKQLENGDLEGKPSSKRLRWVSAVEKTQGTSISSSFTSNSSVEQLLCQRQMDPESMLRSLGFDGGPNSDESANRIPQRFLVNPCAAKGIDIFQFVMTHPELQHMVYERSPPVSVTGTGIVPPLDETDSVTDNAPQPKGSMQQHHFSSVLQGVRFIHTAQSLGNIPPHSPTHHVPDDEMKQISSIPSVLDFPNRRFLARQGFYGKEFASCTRKPKGEQSGKPADKQISAEQRRKQFQHSGRSKNWSLTEDSETDDSSATDKSDPHKDSFDQGFMLRSFSDRFSSESSVESSDSFGDKRDELRRQNSINYLRKQYQDTIKKSMDTGDGELPVFDSELGTFDLEFDIDNERPDRNKLKKQQSIGDMRKAQVDKLMSAEEDDGDYFAHSFRSSWKEQLLKQAQNSTQSTITGSPVTPKEFRYSFEKTLQDGDKEFTFPDTNSDSNSKVLKDQSSAISIVIEDEGGVEEPIAFENCSNVQSNPNELTPLSLIKRTDSSNTIVQGDNLSDIEHSEGDATPRPGDVSPGLLLQPPDFIDNKLIHTDAFSESTSSTETLATMFPADNDVETISNKPLKDTDEKQCDTVRLGNHSEVKVHVSQDAVKDFLKPDLPRPQESFELEEISSADNPYEDINGNTSKTYLKLGQLEKSLSTHSDSSGFADIDQAMETPPITELSGGITPGFEMAKRRRQSLTKQRTLGGGLIHGYLEEHQYRSTQSPLPQTENRERKVCGSVHATMQHYNQEKFEMMNKENVHNRLHLCGKASSLEDTENINPALQSITYIPSEQAQSDKSVVYSISVPMVTNIPRPEPVGQVRYVSSVKFDIDSESSADNDSVKSFKIKQAGPVLHQKIITDLDIGEGQNINNESKEDLDLCRTNLDFVNNVEIETKGATSRLQNISKGQITDLMNELPTRNRNNAEEQRNLQNNSVSSESVKNKILSKKRTKEALIAANSQTADWLLSNGKQINADGNQQDFTKMWLHGRIGRPIWASTPDLNSRILENERNVKISQSRQIGKSLDMDIDDELDEDRFKIQMSQQSFSKHTSLDESASVYHQPSNLQNYSEQSTVMIQDAQHFAQEMRQSYLPSNVDEGVQGDGNSYIGSSTGMPEEQVQYMKLAKLVNGPSLIVGTNIKMPVVKFTPNIQMKDWTLLPKQKHLEEETRLMQHAVQRYKVELIAMETMLFNMKQVAEQHLNKEERSEVEELQHLWSEVRKEVNKMEDLLSLRLTSVLNGNISYNPLDAVEIVHTMIELLREQLYHQQMCIERDTDIDNIDENEAETRSFGYVSNRSASSADPLLSDLTNQMSDIKLSLSRSQIGQKEEFKQSLSELKESILSEVKQEVTSTQNVKMLQLQVQAREEEIKRLKLELLQQNIEAGKTRKRQTIESDV